MSFPPTIYLTRNGLATQKIWALNLWPIGAYLMESHDAIVIGAGQAGLTMSHALRQHGIEHIILERRSIAESWRYQLWKSLRFQFPSWSVELPGCRYQGDDADGFAHHSEILQLIVRF